NPKVMGDFKVSLENLNHLAGLTEGFVGAEIEQVVIDGLFEAFYEERSIQLVDFQKVCKQFVPLSVTQAEHIKAIRDWASVRAVAATPREDRKDYSESNDTANNSNDVKASRGGRTIDF